MFRNYDPEIGFTWMSSDAPHSNSAANPERSFDSERRVRGPGLQPDQGSIPVGRVPPRGVAVSASSEHPPRRLRRLPRIWTDRDGIVSFLLTICIQDRAPVLANEAVFDRVVLPCRVTTALRLVASSVCDHARPYSPDRAPGNSSSNPRRMDQSLQSDGL